jgi:uncharacterized delta-60 repeat protein
MGTIRRRVCTTAMALLVGFASQVASATGTAGTLDASFGAGGVALDPMTLGSGGASVGVQSDGRIVRGTHVSNGNPSTYHWAFRRYLSDGSRDMSFGASGETVLFGADGSQLRHLVVDRLDRVVAVGRTVVTVGSGRRATTALAITVVRLDPDGALDSSFGSGGVVRVVRSGESSPRAEAVAIQADDRIVVAGGTSLPVKKALNRALFVMRLTDAGSLDVAFGSGGVVVHDLSSEDDEVHVGALAIQSTGRIVVGGRIGVSQSSPGTQWVLTRYRADGTVDTSFGTVVVGVAELRGIALDSSDRILVCATPASLVPTQVVVGRHLPNGVLDVSFGVNGVGGAGASETTQAFGIRALAGDRSVVVASLGSGGSGVRATAVRFLSDGSVDGSFGSAGFATPVGEPGIQYNPLAGGTAAVDVFGNLTVVGERIDAADLQHRHAFLARWLGD